MSIYAQTLQLMQRIFLVIFDRCWQLKLAAIASSLLTVLAVLLENGLTLSSSNLLSWRVIKL